MFTARCGVKPHIQSLVADQSVRRPRFDSRSVYVKFVEDIVAQGLTFIRVLNFALSVALHQLSIVFII